MSHIVIDGNLAADPDAGVSGKGTAWARFRVITNDRYTDKADTWVDGPPVSWQVTAFRRLAENITDCLHRGDRVVVSGDLTVKSYRDADGNERTSRDIIAGTVGASLSLATVSITRNTGRTADPEGGIPAGDDVPPPLEEPAF